MQLYIFLKKRLTSNQLMYMYILRNIRPAPVLFSPLSPSLSAIEFKPGGIQIKKNNNCVNYNVTVQNHLQV